MVLKSRMTPIAWWMGYTRGKVANR